GRGARGAPPVSTSDARSLGGEAGYPETFVLKLRRPASRARSSPETRLASGAAAPGTRRDAELERSAAPASAHAQGGVTSFRFLPLPFSRHAPVCASRSSPMISVVVISPACAAATSAFFAITFTNQPPFFEANRTFAMSLLGGPSEPS